MKEICNLIKGMKELFHKQREKVVSRGFKVKRILDLKGPKL